MKTFLLKTCGVIFTAIIMVSCLGGDSYFEKKDDFVYVRNVDFGNGIPIKCAVATGFGGYIVDKVIDGLEEGRGYFVNYKVSQVTSSGYAKADYFDLVGDGKPVPIAEFKWDRPYSNIPSSIRGDSIHPLSMNIEGWSAFQFIDDNWLINYNVSKKEDEKVEAYFYYNPDGQHMNGEPLSENRIIIDVRFVKTEKVTENANISTHTLRAMGSLEEIRKNYRPKYPSGVDYADVAVRFRYVQYKVAPDLPTITYLGNFGDNPQYIMRFIEE